ncbi:hypothetical protein HZH66_002815 [Vespula vulgaris]|uniref:Uncharacterized protein n=1 Tax=Vespula vulgaris TaxID=7454 RepID=A0A834KKH2_VESVU|nr:hypothetical protein HZH66_002815 [Vespula vulgaris]
MQNFIPEILSQNETSRMHHPSVVTLASPRSSKSLLSSRRSWPSLANRDVSRLALRNRESHATKDHDDENEDEDEDEEDEEDEEENEEE